MLYYENDMKIPILNSMYNNFSNLTVKNDFDKRISQKLSFYRPNLKKIPSIKILGFNKILNETGFVLINVVNEILVERFLKKKIFFSDIVKKLLNVLNSKKVKNFLKNDKIKNIQDVFKTYNFCRKLMKC
jgi:1-deoxy-D-xylulose-5-phosphate reductoisomerase